MRLVLIAIMALVILGGGGAGAYFYFMQPAEASVGEDEAHMTAGESDKKHAKAKKDKEEHAAFVTLDPLILPVIDKRGLSQSLSLVVVLEVPNDAAKAEVEHLAPRLKDAYIQNMYGVLNKKEVMPNGVLEVGIIKERLNEVSMEVLGEDKFNEVLLQVIQQRPI